MKLLEYAGKELFKKYGIDTPKGKVISSKDELHNIDIPFPWVMKAQVLVGGRGKAGGIKFAENMEEAEKIFDELMNMEIKGEKVRKILIEEKLNIEKEYYLSFFLDRSSREYLMMFSPEGGVDIEAMAERVIKTNINPLIGLQPYHLRRIPKEARNIATNLFRLFIENDCELAEINPLAISNGRAIAADAKVIIDNNALYRHPELPKEDVELTPLEKEAREKGIAFVQLDGNIGVIANGAGLTMATLDALNEFDGKGGVFLDLGGTDDPEKVKQAFELMAKAKPKVILLNLFGGITKCDTVARGIIEFMEEHKLDCPVVARIKGMNEDVAREMLSGYVIAVESFQEAARKAAELGRD
ncbi:MAG TPA: ADP-forming succinate--CoA ligase subunit beta [Thermoplasmatales archaeon]|nr:ADP-forming succinate--CoA ligase subunit beta [Thermoplasmatales archaeon]